MKKLLLSMAVITSFGVSAQNMPQSALAAAKPTGVVSERLIGISSYTDPTMTLSPLILTDTAVFTYSSSHNSVFDYLSMHYADKYNALPNYMYGCFSANNYFTTYNRVDADQADFYVWNTGTSSFDLDTKRTMTFDAAGHPTMISSQVNPPTGTTDVLVFGYDAMGRPVSALEYMITGSGTDTFQRRGVVYNSLGKPQYDTVDMYTTSSSWAPDRRNNYQYDSDSNLTDVKYYTWMGSMYVYERQDSFIYYTNHLVKQHCTKVYGTATSLPVMNYLDSMGYTPGVAGYTFYTNWDIDTATGINTPSARIHFHVNASTVPDSGYSEIYDPGTSTWNLYYTIALDFNANGNPITQREAAYSGGALAAEGVYHYYYENYTPAAIADIKSKTSSLKVYPNPAKEKVQLTWVNNGRNTSSSILVCNSLGQVVQSTRIPAGFNETELSLANQSAGNYFITISQEGEIVGWATLVKQ